MANRKRTVSSLQRFVWFCFVGFVGKRSQLLVFSILYFSWRQEERRNSGIKWVGSSLTGGSPRWRSFQPVPPQPTGPAP